MAFHDIDSNFSNSLRRAHSFETLTPNMEELSCSLEKFHEEQITTERYSESSIEISIVSESDDEEVFVTSFVPGLRQSDSGVCDRSCASVDVVQLLEQKVEFLGEVFAEQRELLASIRDEMEHTNEIVERVVRDQTQITYELVKHAILQRFDSLCGGAPPAEAGRAAAATTNTRAKALLDALNTRQNHHSTTIDAMLQSSLNDLLHSDAFYTQILSATISSVDQLIKESFTRELMMRYMPLLEHSHRQLMKKVSRIIEDTLNEMEANVQSLSRSSYKSSRVIKQALKNHQRLLENAQEPHQKFIEIANSTLRSVLEQELSSAHAKFSSMLADVTSCELPTGYEPSSPPQPVQPDRSAIELLMNAAEIHEQMKEDINGSFEKALSASDLSLVMVACRAADPAVVFNPCRLQQPVLLSLLQQLATDMVHDTQLKCRYLEEALMNMDINDAATRVHYPLVIGEMLKNLTTFITTFPSHMSSRRIKMLIMAAKSLMKPNDQILAATFNA